MCVFFERILNVFLKIILKCDQDKNKRKSKTYLERKNGAFSKTSAFIGVIEPQSDGRLHYHLNIYSSNMTPFIIENVICNDELRKLCENTLTVFHTHF